MEVKNKGNIIEILEYLSKKSDDLFQEQMKSYNSTITKASIIIPISTVFLPLALAITVKTDSFPFINYLIAVTVFFMTFGLFYLLKVLFPKGLYHGFDFNQFQKLSKKSYKEVLEYNIGANKDSYSDNEEIVNNQNKYLKRGLIFVFISSLMIVSIIILNNNMR